MVLIKEMKKGRRGFTLIEILIVVAIISILSSVVLIGLGPTQSSGRDARRLSDLRQTMNGLELYYNKCGYYPGTSVASPCGNFAQINSDGWNAITTSLTGSGIGISTLPKDPVSGHTYFYGSNAAGSSYIVAATLENVNNTVFTSYTAPAVAGYTISGNSGATNSFTNCGSPVGTYCLTL